MKEKKEKQKERAKILCEKLIEKQEKLKQIKKEREKYKKNLENKLEKMSQKKDIFDRKKEMEYQIIKKQRNELFKRIQNNKKEIEKEEELRREDILFEEFNKLGRMPIKDDFGRAELNNIQSQTLILSREEYELRKDFLKKLSKLKEESVSKKSDKQKRKMYTDKLRSEAERKRKEEEERLEKLGMV